ncbi:MAG: response regulator [Pseudomonadota bacterium]
MMGKSDFSKCKILIVDDDRDLVAVLEIQLRFRGYDISIANDAENGLALARKVRPDIALLDFGLPDLNGVELAAQLRRHFETTCVGIIMLTARSDFDTMRNAVVAGADDYLLKPYDINELCTRIEMLLERRRRRFDWNPLTGLPGDRAIQDELEFRVQEKLPFALGFLDIDNFKPFNDAYGRDMGDQTISLLARVLEEALTEYGNENDFLGHLGVDDFVFLTTPDKLDTLKEPLFERFRAGIHDLCKSTDSGCDIGNIDFTLSIGVMTNESSKPLKRRRVFELATRAKHQAKSHSGDCFVVWRGNED